MVRYDGPGEINTWFHEVFRGPPTRRRYRASENMSSIDVTAAVFQVPMAWLNARA
jgi:hypothetical protein